MFTQDKSGGEIGHIFIEEEVLINIKARVLHTIKPCPVLQKGESFEKAIALITQVATGRPHKKLLPEFRVVFEAGPHIGRDRAKGGPIRGVC